MGEPSGGDGSGSPVGIGDLTDALLEQCFALVCRVEPRARSGAPAYRPCSCIPAVCQRWRAVYTSSTVLWAALELDWSEVVEEFILQGSYSLIPLFGYASKWVADRAPCIASLRFSGCHVLGTALEQQLFRLCRQATRLRSVELRDITLSADSLLEQLAQCGTLQEIGIHCQRTAGPMQPLTVSAGGLKALSGLTALQALTLNVDKVLGSTRDIGEALSRLTQFKFVGRREAVVLHPEFINTLAHLRSLELGNCRLGQFTPRTAEVLSHVTFLGVTDVLAAKPRKKAGTTLWEGLKYLDGLQQLRVQEQDCAGMPASALACTGLRGLTLLRSAADFWLGPNSLVTQPHCLGVLESLHLQELRLEQPIPSQFWQCLRSLTKLVWTDVQLLSLDGTLVPRLLASHHAMPIPPELSRLLGLQHLCLEYAQLDQVPNCLFALTNLRRLSLEGNSVQSLPEGHYLTGIEHLSLAADAVRTLPEGLRVCRALRTLSLARNPDLHLTPADMDHLAMCCTRLERIQLTEANGLLMGHLADELEGELEEELEGGSELFPQLLVWEDDHSLWD